MATYSSSPIIEYVSYQEQFTGSNLPSNGNLVHTDTHTFVSSVPANTTYQVVYSFMASSSGALTLTVRKQRNDFTNWSNLGGNSTDVFENFSTYNEPLRRPDDYAVWQHTEGGTSNTAIVSRDKFSETVLTSAGNIFLPDDKILIDFKMDNVEGAEYAAYYVQFKKTTFP